MKSRPWPSPRVKKGGNALLKQRVCEDWLVTGEPRLAVYSLPPCSCSPFPRLGGSRVDNEEEEEGEGGLEQSCPPNAYQMHPPPEGCCTTDGEMPARLRAEGPRGVSRARVASRSWPGGPSRPSSTGYTAWGPVRLTVLSHSWDSLTVTNAFRSKS